MFGWKHHPRMDVRGFANASNQTSCFQPNKQNFEISFWLWLSFLPLFLTTSHSYNGSARIIQFNFLYKMTTWSATLILLWYRMRQPVPGIRMWIFVAKGRALFCPNHLNHPMVKLTTVWMYCSVWFLAQVFPIYPEHCVWWKPGQC